MRLARALIGAFRTFIDTYGRGLDSIDLVVRLGFFMGASGGSGVLFWRYFNEHEFSVVLACIALFLVALGAIAAYDRHRERVKILSPEYRDAVLTQVRMQLRSLADYLVRRTKKDMLTPGSGISEFMVAESFVRSMLGDYEASEFVSPCRSLKGKERLTEASEWLRGRAETVRFEDISASFIEDFRW